MVQDEHFLGLRHVRWFHNLVYTRWVLRRLAGILALKAIVNRAKTGGSAGVACVSACLIDILPEDVVFLALAALITRVSVDVV